ncbi:hypothetical protein LEN26_006242 [Aphanomyces euteiches]|nr:hypothetical protein LEN26_006242 [Aphanomyces euteiches]
MMWTSALASCSFDQLLSLRGLARYLFASLAINMLLQAMFIGYKLVEVVQTSAWSSMGFTLLVSCYAAWIAISFLGGLFGLYSAHRYHIPSAIWCLYTWVALALFQIVEATIAIVTLVPEAHFSPEATHTLVWNTLSLLMIELAFVVFIHGYIQLLQLCEPTDRWVAKGKDAQDVMEAMLSPVVNQHNVSYGTESSMSFTI